MVKNNKNEITEAAQPDAQPLVKPKGKPRGRTGPRGHTNNPNGRPKGTANKISGKAILDELEARGGRPFAEQLAINYYKAIDNGMDGHLIAKYDQLILNKVVADKTHIDIEYHNQQLIDDIVAKLGGNPQ